MLSHLISLLLAPILIIWMKFQNELNYWIFNFFRLNVNHSVELPLQHWLPQFGTFSMKRAMKLNTFTYNLKNLNSHLVFGKLYLIHIYLVLRLLFIVIIVYWLTEWLTNPPIQSLIHPSTHSFTQLLTHSLTYSLVHLLSSSLDYLLNSFFT